MLEKGWSLSTIRWKEGEGDGMASERCRTCRWQMVNRKIGEKGEWYS